MKQYNIAIQGMSAGQMMVNYYTIVSKNSEDATHLAINLFEQAYPYVTAACVQGMSKIMDIAE